MIQSVPLSAICALITDGTHYTPPNIGNGIPFLTVKDMNGRSLDFVNCAKISAEEYDKAQKQNSAPQLGDVLFSKDGTVGKVYVVHEQREFAVLSSIAILRPDTDQVAPEYLAQYLKAPKALAEAGQRKTGSALTRIILKDIRQLRIPLPPLDEQWRIAAILDAADSLRAKRRAALAKLDQLAQSIFIEMFGDPAEGSNGYELLGEHLGFVTSGGRGWAQFYAPVGDRFIRSLDVRMNYIGNQEAVFVTPPDNAEARRTKVEAGDVLLTITGSRIGRVAPVPLDFGPAYISQHVAILRVDQRAIVPTFLSFFLSLPAGGQRQIARAQYGQTKPGLNFEQIRNFRVPVPPVKEQLEFARRVAASKALRAKSQASSICIDDLFSSLQHRAFRGEL